MAKTAIMKVWNVELGLAIHVKSPNGKYIVIDLGSTKDVSPISTLQNKEVGYMVITHPHLDHFSDVENLGNAKPKVLWRCQEYTSTELINEATLDKKHIVRTYCTFVSSYNEELTSSANPSNPNTFGGLTASLFNTNECDKSNKNNFSAIVVLKLGNAKIVVCGDNEKDSFNYLMQKENFKESVKNAWVMVAPHHGRESGYCDEFVSLVNPYITIISDTSKGSTSVSEKYSNKSKGFNIYNRNTGKHEERKCLTTRNDGNICIEFGETDDQNYSGTLDISIDG